MKKTKTDNYKLAIGLATYKRPKMLEKCLKSLDEINIPQDLEICIIIADNDPKGSSKELVETLKKEIKIPISYDIEKGRGIPYARNNVLRQADKLDIDYLAFIDDDEWVDKDWLVNHWDYMKRSDADVTIGPVISIYPKNAPKWAVKGNFFQRRISNTGVLKTTCATNNVLFDFKKIVKMNNVYFDEKIGLQAGEDIVFFREAVSKGAVIRAVNHAIVSEEVPKQRLKLSYFLKRRFRDINGKSVNKQKKLNNIERVKMLKKSFIYTIIGLLTLPINIFRGSHKFVWSLYILTRAAAFGFTAIGIYFGWNEYKNTSGN